MGCIYKIANNINSDIYIGSTRDLQHRKWMHAHALRKGKHKSKSLQLFYDDNGENSIFFSEIEFCKNEDLLVREQYWLDLLKPAYNTAKIAGSPLGVKHTIEARKNMSLAHVGKKLSPESIAKRSLKQTGLKRSPETIAKMQQNQQRQAITQYTLSGDFVAHWPSQNEAARKLNLCSSHISGCCNKKRKTCGGFKWDFKK